MKILREPNWTTECSYCGCRIQFEKEDIYSATGGSRKGNPINPHKAIICPICEKSISIWGKESVKQNLKMCANAEEAICILDFIKSEYLKNDKCMGILKYTEAIQMGIDALEKIGKEDICEKIRT